jgi:hypothetical protein
VGSGAASGHQAGRACFAFMKGTALKYPEQVARNAGDLASGISCASCNFFGVVAENGNVYGACPEGMRYKHCLLSSYFSIL